MKKFLTIIPLVILLCFAAEYSNAQDELKDFFKRDLKFTITLQTGKVLSPGTFIMLEYTEPTSYGRGGTWVSKEIYYYLEENEVETQRAIDLSKVESIELVESNIIGRREDNAFIEQVRYQREIKRAEVLKMKEQVEKQKQLSAQNLTKQQKAFSLMEDGDILFKEKDFNKAISSYNEAIGFLKDIGWEEGYLMLLRENIQIIKVKKREYESEKQTEFEIALKQQKEDERFQKRISEYMVKEQEKLKATLKQIDSVTLPFPDKHFDAVIECAALQHNEISEIKEIISESSTKYCLLFLQL